MLKYIILAVLIALGIFLYVQRDAVRRVFRGETTINQEMQQVTRNVKSKVGMGEQPQPMMSQPMMGEEPMMDEEVDMQEMDIEEETP